MHKSKKSSRIIWFKLYTCFERPEQRFRIRIKNKSFPYEPVVASYSRASEFHQMNTKISSIRGIISDVEALFPQIYGLLRIGLWA